LQLRISGSCFDVKGDYGAAFDRSRDVRLYACSA
jgi:hypothetical protein